MALEDPTAPSMPMPKEQPSFNHTKSFALKNAQSVPDSSRRHSLPLHFLPPSLWSSNTSSISLVASGEAAHGEHILDEATVAHRISALRQLNGATGSRHRYAKSTGARNSTFSQPVIVRTYSGAARPPSQQRDPIIAKKQNGMPGIATTKMDMKLPPVEAFSFKGIMEEIRHGVTEDLERIAEICARSKYSLSNQYEVHMPPHGRGEPFLQNVGQGTGSAANGGGPTLQAVGSDDEQTRPMGRGSRGGRRTKSVAYGTLETIMSSSRSSDEDKSKKKPAAVIAEEVRGRLAKLSHESSTSNEALVENAIEAGPAPSGAPKHIRSKSATFASMVMDNVQGSRQHAPMITSPTTLISEPARPQTSTADLEIVPKFGDEPLLSPAFPSFMSKPTTIRNESRASTLRPDADVKPSLLGNFSSWFSWSKPGPSGRQDSGFQGRMRSGSHAEGSLRELLKSTGFDKKGKSIDRSG
ncbi:hypothetical protein B7494_g4420 [Chlorociboria aeruginascens]|nr:hypothetical protein B7494_g4420 [Chlorociboria aeruginascens]